MSRRNHDAMGSAVKDIVNALHRYAKAYEAEYDTPIGDDAIIGDEGWLPIAKATVRLLDGETGWLDPGDTDRIIRELVRAAGFTEKEFDQA